MVPVIRSRRAQTRHRIYETGYLAGSRRAMHEQGQGILILCREKKENKSKEEREAI